MRGDDPDAAVVAHADVGEFPACAGMIRPHHRGTSDRRRVPRMRGDDPNSCTVVMSGDDPRRVPRMRGDDPSGMTEYFPACAGIGEREFPACAGMIRTRCATPGSAQRVPRMRGDDPDGRIRVSRRFCQLNLSADVAQ